MQNYRKIFTGIWCGKAAGMLVAFQDFPRRIAAKIKARCASYCWTVPMGIQPRGKPRTRATASRPAV